jgi:hypothetical protein
MAAQSVPRTIKATRFAIRFVCMIVETQTSSILARIWFRRKTVTKAA